MLPQFPDPYNWNVASFPGSLHLYVGGGKQGEPANKATLKHLVSLGFFRYVRALGAMYLRLVGDSLECFKYLELLYNDYRKLKRKNRNGGAYVW